MAYRVIARWDANTEPDLAGYKLYFGSATGVYNHPDSPLDMGNVTEGTVELERPVGLWFFALTAYDNETPVRESGFSSEVQLDLRNLRAVVAM